MSLYRLTKTFFALSAYIAFLMALPYFASAEVEYMPFVNIPGFDYSTNSLPELINKSYIMLIVVGCLFAVVKITLAGLKWSLSDIVSNKHDAMHDIQGVLLGLALLLSPYIILNTINSDLTDLDVLQGFSDAVGGIDLGEVPQKPLGASRVRTNTCTALSSDPVDVSACITELNCPNGLDGITRDGDTVTCTYTASSKASLEAQEACRMANDTLIEQKRCEEHLKCDDRNGEISIKGRAVVCSYEPEYSIENCDIDDQKTMQDCLARCTELNGAPKTKGNELGTTIECKYIIN